MNIMNKVTLRGLLKNKTRTIVTIIGVILSAAMITAVTTSISSLQQFVIDYTIYEEGDWHGVLYSINPDTYRSLAENNEVSAAAYTKSDGYAILEGSRNEYKPYLHILELGKEAFDMLPIHLVSGRLPQNENEVLISEHIYTNGGVSYKVGDVLTLDVGNRVLEDGTVLSNAGSAYKSEYNAGEKLNITHTRTFTVVGICRRLSYSIEAYFAPGYSILTVSDAGKLQETDRLDVYLKVKKTNQAYKIINDLSEENRCAYWYNSDLLRFSGADKDTAYNTVLYSLAAILIALIMAGSILLIYNSFAISVSERRKQFGLLSGVGATAKQRMRSVIFESLVIAGIGIPIGIISGITGIGVTFYLLRDILKTLMGSDTGVTLSLSVSPVSIVIAILISLVTILISAYIPARRSKKISAMDAIRQTTDIRLTAKQVKTSKLTRKIFGIEGDLALKNLKRNRRRYRSTVISLYMSIVLFVSASSFGMYLKAATIDVYEDNGYDFSYYVPNSEHPQGKIMKVYNKILEIEGIKQGSLMQINEGVTVLKKENINSKFYDERVKRGDINDGDVLTANVSIFSVDHESFVNYVKTLGLDEEQFTDPKSPKGILVDNQHYYDAVEKKFKNSKLLNEKPLDSLAFYCLTLDNVQVETEIAVGAIADEPPFGVRSNDYRYLSLIIDNDLRESGFGNIKSPWYVTYMYFSSEKPLEIADDIQNVLIDEEMSVARLYNMAEQAQYQRNIIIIVSVFSYGFIALISLITIANIFNTISTNMNLRRREFAMLKSVGMTNHSFHKMLNYECVFYGLKALIYGLPSSIGITYLIYRSITEGVEMGFRLPVSSIAVSVISVFLIVFVCMMYSMSKIRKENIIDALKNENL